VFVLFSRKQHPVSQRLPVFLFIFQEIIHSPPRSTMNNMSFNQERNPIEKSLKDAKLIPLPHKYMTPHFPGLVQALHQTVARLK
jgi:hypothetical protein